MSLVDSKGMSLVDSKTTKQTSNQLSLARKANTYMALADVVKVGSRHSQGERIIRVNQALDQTFLIAVSSYRGKKR